MICREQFAIVKNYWRILCVIEVSSGQTVPLTGTLPSNRILKSTLSTQISSPNFEVPVLEHDKQYNLYSYKYNPNSRNYSVAITQRLVTGRDWSPIGVSVHNEVVFMPTWREDKVTVGFDVREFGSAKECIPRKMTIPSAEGRQELTIPKQSGNDNLINSGDYVGMTEGYFIYHDATNHTLTLAGFWPSW